MFTFFKKEKTNYAKIIGITLAVVAGVAALGFIAWKLMNKYFICYDCDCECDELDDCECECELCDCDEAEEAIAETEAIEA